MIMRTAHLTVKPSLQPRSVRTAAHLFACLVLVLLLTTTTVAAASSNECPNDCGPNGNCITDTRPSCGEESDLCTTKCKCNPGWDGPDCDTQVVMCPEPLTHSPEDAQTCFNGGKCVEQKVDLLLDPDGVGMVCDCSTAAIQDVAYAGHQCENYSEESCELGQEFSTYAFCVNGGTCKELVPIGSPHPLCDCPDEYKGRHCQFAAGTAPQQEQILVPKDGYKNDSEWTAMAKFLLAVIVMAIFAFLVVCFLRRRRARLQGANNHTKPSVRAITADLDLDTNDEIDGDDKEII